MDRLTNVVAAIKALAATGVTLRRTSLIVLYAARGTDTVIANTTAALRAISASGTIVQASTIDRTRSICLAEALIARAVTTVGTVWLTVNAIFLGVVAHSVSTSRIGTILRTNGIAFTLLANTVSAASGQDRRSSLTAKPSEQHKTEEQAHDPLDGHHILHVETFA